ncbi:MAG: MscS family membrane protein [Saprospiraceae bacterium]|jgi:MscS family membrane protein
MEKVLTIIFCILITFGANSQPTSSNGSPYDVIYNHLYYLQADSYNSNLAAKSFQIDSDTLSAVKSAIKLKQILDGKGLFIQLNDIPNDPTYLDSVTNNSSFVIFPEKLPWVYVEKINNEWFYSDQTVQAIGSVHKEVYPLGSDLLVNLLPKADSGIFLGLYLWQYLGILIFLVISFIGFFVFNFIFRKILFSIHAISQTFLKSRTEILRGIHYLLALWAVSILLSFLIPILQLPVTVNEAISLILQIASSIIFLLFAFKIFELAISSLERVTLGTESKMDDQLLPLLKRAGQFVILAFWLFHLLSVLNVNITTLIAGLSIGGLAVALAAQDTLKNLFGSIMIFLDRPFQIGDWVKFNEGEGTVEEVGFRSTRIRSFANSVIYVPNSRLSDSMIDNFGLRIYRRYSTKIGITYDTPPDRIEEFIIGLRLLVTENPNISNENYEIHLNDLGASAFEILFYIFFKVPDWSAELKEKHNLLMEIIKLAHSVDVKFAFPSQSIYIEQQGK